MEYNASQSASGYHAGEQLLATEQVCLSDVFSQPARAHADSERFMLSRCLSFHLIK